MKKSPQVVQKISLRLQLKLMGFNIDEILQEIKNSVDAFTPFQKVKNQQYKNKNPEVWEVWEILLDFIKQTDLTIYGIKRKIRSN